jgi:hypothetical protein
VALYPGSVQFKEGHIEGEPLEVHFELVNESRQPVTVTAVSTSCGCMALSGEDGALKTPFSLGAEAKRPITLSIATAARVGRQTFALRVAAEGPRGRPLQTRAEVHVNLLGTLRSDRPMVIFRGAKPDVPLAAEVKLADMLPDAGAFIREVRTSNPDSIRVAVVPTSGPSTIFGDKVAAQSRAILRISYTPGAAEGRIQEMITVVPEDSRYPTLQIPLYCEMAEPPVRFVPSGLTLSAGGETAFRRTVTLQTDTPETSVSILECPGGVKVQLGARSGCEQKLTVEGDLSQLNTQQADIRFAVNGLEITFPIRVLP